MFKNIFVAAALAALLLPVAGHAQAPQTYAGNGGSGFTGTVGNGSLTVSSDPSSGGTVTFTLNPSGSFTSNDFVLYLDTVSGGFTDTSNLGDAQDGSRRAISGTDGSNRTVATFASGFGADKAISFENNTFTGLFNLAAGGNNSLQFVTGPTSGGPSSLTVSYANLGVSPGQTIQFVGSLISTSAYRSNETIGPSTTAPGTLGDTPNAGFNGTLVFTGSNSYSLAPVPEPSQAAVLGLGALGLCVLGLRARRRVA